MPGDRIRPVHDREHLRAEPTDMPRTFVQRATPEDCDEGNFAETRYSGSNLNAGDEIDCPPNNSALPFSGLSLFHCLKKLRQPPLEPP